jgi:hypothetical protein
MDGTGNTILKEVGQVQKGKGLLSHVAYRPNTNTSNVKYT